MNTTSECFSPCGWYKWPGCNRCMVIWPYLDVHWYILYISQEITTHPNWWNRLNVGSIGCLCGLSMQFAVSVCLGLSLSVLVPVFGSGSEWRYIIACVTVCLVFVYTWHCVYVALFLFLLECVTVFVCVWLSVCVSVSLCFSVCVCVTLSQYVAVYQFVCRIEPPSQVGEIISKTEMERCSEMTDVHICTPLHQCTPCLHCTWYRGRPTKG